MRISPIAPDQLRRLKRDFLGCHPGQAVPVAYQDHGRVAVAVTARGARCRRAAPHVDVRQRIVRLSDRMERLLRLLPNAVGGAPLTER